MDSPSNQQLIEQLYQDFANGEVAKVLSTFAAEIEWSEAEHSPYAGDQPLIGADAVANHVFQRILRDFNDFKLVPLRYYPAQEAVVVEGRYQGEAKETKRPLTAQFVHIWQLKGNKVASFQQYTDTHAWRESLRLS